MWTGEIIGRLESDSHLSSDAFSLSSNVQTGDPRAGLDVASKREILKIMKGQKVNFDEARQVFILQKLANNGISPDGRPMGKSFRSSPCTYTTSITKANVNA